MCAVLRSQLWVGAGVGVPSAGAGVGFEPHPSPSPIGETGGRGGVGSPQGLRSGQATPCPQKPVASVAMSSWPQLTPLGLCYF